MQSGKKGGGHHNKEMQTQIKGRNFTMQLPFAIFREKNHSFSITLHSLNTLISSVQ